MPQRLLTILRPPELPQSDDPEELRKYNVRVNRYQFNVAISVMALLIMTAWAASPIGFARAQNVKPQIDEALTPVKKELAETQNFIKQVSEAQAVNGKLLRLSLANAIAADIRFLKSKQCKTPVSQRHERESFQREIEIKQDEYRNYKGFEYPVPNCGDL